ncbi:MAG: pilin [Patescibacteria group bacterium]|nr:pilin [Patescibacteria group bacterium]MCL5431980.1 pilin [Patescibacteria group bacterium]
MNKKLVKIAAPVAAVAALLSSALPTFAASTVNLCENQQGFQIGNLCNVTLVGLVQTALNTVLFVAFVAALVFLIIGGIRWIMSGGDKEGTTKAKEAVTAALIGLAIVIGAWVLINIVLQFFGIGGGLSGLSTPVLQQK